MQAQIPQVFAFIVSANTGTKVEPKSITTKQTTTTVTLPFNKPKTAPSRLSTPLTRDILVTIGKKIPTIIFLWFRFI